MSSLVFSDEIINNRGRLTPAELADAVLAAAGLRQVH
jgi:hypothetical protein